MDEKLTLAKTMTTLMKQTSKRRVHPPKPPVKAVQHGSPNVLMTPLRNCSKAMVLGVGLKIAS